jgi:HPr kinase/phosphorylase
VAPDILCHASAVAVEGRGVLIKGAAGSGKSTLSLQLMSLGADLIADDQTLLRLERGEVWATAPQTIAGLIEARGVGILRARHTDAAIALVVDLDLAEKDRLPLLHTVTVLGHSFPCLHKVDSPAWPASILQYLKGTRKHPE